MKRIALLLTLLTTGCSVFDPNAAPTGLDYFIADTARIIGHHDPQGPLWNYGEHSHSEYRK